MKKWRIYWYINNQETIILIVTTFLIIGLLIVWIQQSLVIAIIFAVIAAVFALFDSIMETNYKRSEKRIGPFKKN